MKRSAMIKKVAKAVKPVLKGDVDENMSMDLLVEIVLSELETNGMVPPPFKITYNSHRGDDLISGKWEKE